MGAAAWMDMPDASGTGPRAEGVIRESGDWRESVARRSADEEPTTVRPAPAHKAQEPES